MSTVRLYKTFKRSTLTLVICGLSVYQNAHAADCQPDWIIPPQAIPSTQTHIEIEADKLMQPHRDQIELHGQVCLSQSDLVVLGERIDYNLATETLQVFGQVQLHQASLLIESEYIEFDQRTQKAKAFATRYQMTESRAHGYADTMNTDRNSGLSDLSEASYTTCALERPDWQLNFKQLHINEDKRRIYGKHTWLHFKNVPVFYTPYFDFPMDDRASGLLFPTYGSQKSAAQSNGLSFVNIPYYFNIAPNMDSTLGLAYIEQRGLLLNNELRYLQPNHQGQLHFSYIQDQLTQKQGRRYVTPDGQVQTTEATNERWRARFQGRQRWSGQVQSYIDWHAVSDKDFFNDLPALEHDGRQGRHSNELLRQAQIQYRDGPWQAHLQSYGYLRLRNAEVNYEKQPEVGISYAQNFGPMGLQIYTEATDFTLPSGHRDRVYGQRYLAQPRLSYNLQRSYGYVRAQAQANHRSYQLQHAPRPEHNAPTSTVMQYALRGGLIFDRPLEALAADWTQTLEPELQYLLVPYQDQSALPVFDTGLASTDFSNLFRLNRFSGHDRIGDTQQISAALTTRLLNPQGLNVAEAGLGQIFYLQDRRVDLNTVQHGDAEQQQRSDYFAKIGMQFDRFQFASTSQYREKDWQLTHIQNRLKFNFEPYLTLLAVHQGQALDQRETRQQTLATGIMFNLNHQWQWAHYLQYDLEQQHTHEMAAGIRYASCCWASELIMEQTQMADGRYNYGIRYVIELKGLSSMGNRLSETLEDNLSF